MKITKRQLRRLVNEAMGHDFGIIDVQDGATHPHILAIRMVEALRPVIQSGNVEASLEALDALWDHLRNTSPVPTNYVPENEPEDNRDLLAMQHDATEEQEAWRDSIEEGGLLASLLGEI